MSQSCPLLSRLTASVVLAVCTFIATPAHAADWARLDPADLALTKPRIDPAADAEVMLWDVRITDSTDLDTPSTILNHYLRIKVFTDRGRESRSKVDLTYSDTARVRDVEGRTIAPDGSIRELRGADIFDRTIIEADGLKLKAKSFVLPAAVPGAIIEYRWTEVRDDSVANYLELELQHELPAWAIRYHLKPLAVRDIGYQMRIQTFNLASPPAPKKEDGGYTLLEVQNVPGLRQETYMPPRLSLIPWTLIFYADVSRVELPLDRFWQKYAKDEYDRVKNRTKNSGDVTTIGRKLTEGTTTTDQKIERLLSFVRERITRDDAAARRRQAGRDDGAADTLKRGNGSSFDITFLFVALANAAGLETYVAEMPDRSEIVFRPESKQDYFLQKFTAAIKLPDRWIFVDPNNGYSPTGHVRWQQEGAPALILDGKGPTFAVAPLEEPRFSVKRRTADLVLGENGSLTGQVTLEYTGHAAVATREHDDGDTDADRQKALLESLQKTIPGIEVSDFTVRNGDVAAEPYQLKFRINVPGYAQRTGSRLFVQPAILQRGIDQLFGDDQRRQAVYFPYAWSEEDTIAISLPAGYEVEAGARPAPANINGGEIAAHSLQISVDDATKRLVISRRFEVGGAGTILFRPQDYPVVKNFFQSVQKSDGFTLSLRRVGSGAATQ